MDILTETNRTGGVALAADREGTVRALPWARELEERHVALLASVAAPHWYEAGTELVSQGDVLKSVHIIVSGKVEIACAGDVWLTMQDGDLLALLLQLGPNVHGMRATALVPTTTIALSFPHLMRVLEESPVVMREGLTDFAKAVLAMRRVSKTLADARPAAADARTTVAAPGLALGDRMRFLCDAFPFARVNMEFVGDLAQVAHRVVVADEEYLWDDDADTSEIVVVQSGRIVSRARPGAEETAIGPGSVLGLLEALAKHPRAFARADGVVTVLRFTASDFFEALHSHVEMGRAFAEGVSRAALRELEAHSSRTDR